MTRPWFAPLAVALALAASSCTSGLAFVQDRRLDITQPTGNKKVSLPLTVRWTVHDFHVTGPDGSATPNAGYFGVFLDRTPVPPGKPLTWIARDDKTCARIPGCPDTTYLNERHVYATTSMQITFNLLPDLDASGGHETHDVTIVLLDGRGMRIGESEWYATFHYDRKGP
ncbi:MAG TPA: hypothetical protein VJ818_07490 [Actinomycetota bacterium]|nr:hypothetical protein [Actinomycetota bacterium]